MSRFVSAAASLSFVFLVASIPQAASAVPMYVQVDVKLGKGMPSETTARAAEVIMPPVIHLMTCRAADSLELPIEPRLVDKLKGSMKPQLKVMAELTVGGKGLVAALAPGFQGMTKYPVIKLTGVLKPEKGGSSKFDARAFPVDPTLLAEQHPHDSAWSRLAHLIESGRRAGGACESSADRLAELIAALDPAQELPPSVWNAFRDAGWSASWSGIRTLETYWLLFNGDARLWVTGAIAAMLDTWGGWELPRAMADSMSGIPVGPKTQKEVWRELNGMRDVSPEIWGIELEREGTKQLPEPILAGEPGATLWTVNGEFLGILPVRWQRVSATHDLELRGRDGRSCELEAVETVEQWQLDKVIGFGEEGPACVYRDFHELPPARPWEADDWGEGASE